MWLRPRDPTAVPSITSRKDGATNSRARAHEYLPGRFLHVSRRRAREHDHLGGAVPHRPRPVERLQVADQDCGVHQRHEMRARTAGQRDGLGERQGQVRGRLSRRHDRGWGRQCAVWRSSAPASPVSSSSMTSSRMAARRRSLGVHSRPRPSVILPSHSSRS